MARLTLILTVLTTLIALLGGFKYLMYEIRTMRDRKQQTGKWLLLVLFCLLPSLVEAAGNEARCDDLGENCVCSEPFLMTSFTQSGPTSFWNPTDTTTKECGYEVAGHPISRNTQDVQRRTDATALARLGNTISGFVSQGDGASGISFIGADINTAALGSTYNARMAARFYTYYNTAYNFRDDTPACHSKFLQGSIGSWHFENFEGYIHMYDFAGANWGTTSGTYFPRDCCWNAPGAAVTLDNADWLGHWFRVETVMTNRGTAGWRTILYMKDVTTTGVTKINGGNEFVAADTYGTDTGPDDWTTDFNQQIISSPRQLPMVINLYREVGAGACNGWRGISHFMVAGWDTDAGQRIGAATEIEGGGGGGGTIALFLNTWWLELVPVAGMFWQARRMILSGLMAIGLFLASTGVLIKTQTQALTHHTKQISYTAATLTMHGVVKVLEKVAHKGGRHDT